MTTELVVCLVVEIVAEAVVDVIEIKTEVAVVRRVDNFAVERSFAFL